MDRSNSKASDFERRASVRRSARVSLNALEGDDEMSLQALGVADGFRPPMADDAADDWPRAQSSPPTSVPTPATSALVPGNLPTPPRPVAAPPRPSSITKPPRPSHDSFSLRHDGAMGPLGRAPSQLSRVSSLSSTTTTSASTFVVRTAEDPYEGPSGPSHPYQMYPQSVRVARTLSVATTSSSTAPLSESTYAGPRGPAHPYGLYNQNTVPMPGMSDDAEEPSSSIQVGFPGLPDNYQRRIGPEGEEIADLIGPDGHTEQLPPYTRYPDETYASKEMGVDQLAPTPTPAPAPALHPIPGAGGLGLATLNPEFESAEDLSPSSRQSVRSFVSGQSGHNINTAALTVSEKPSARRRLQMAAKKGVFGFIPRWVICVLFTFLIILAVVIGAVIGAVITKHTHHSHRTGGSTTTTTALTVTVTYDATSIPVPTNLPPLPTGTYLMPLTVNQAPATCFNNTKQSSAWTCNLIFGDYVGMTMTVNEKGYMPGNPIYDVSMSCNESWTLASGVISYGAQPPLIPGTYTMDMVNDTSDPTGGPAWFTMVPYNKTVIVQEQALAAAVEDGALPPSSSWKSPSSSSSSKQRRHGWYSSAGDFLQKGVAQPGDQPWICTWPDTIIELFIFPEQDVSSSTATPPSSATASSSATGTVSSSASSLYGAPTPGPTWGSSSGSSSSSSSTPQSAGSASPTSGPLMIPFPRLVKVEERRLPNSPPATCRQVSVGPDGQATQVYANGEPVLIVITEDESDFFVSAGSSSKRDLGRELFRRDNTDYLSNCGCIWYNS